MPASIPSITVLLTRETKRKLERLAESEGIKVGPYVRRLIERELLTREDDDARAAMQAKRDPSPSTERS
jgi:hypothetical protein